jgi:integrase
MYPAFVLLLVYGLRRGEVLGLSWRDADFEHGIIKVRQQLVRARNNSTSTRSKQPPGDASFLCSVSPATPWPPRRECG